MIRKTAFIFAVILAVFPASAHAAESWSQYFSLMKRDLVRGVKNVVSHPAEIPITFQEYHESPGYPVVRHIAGLTDGLFQAITRLGSGLWDILPASVLPGVQDGVPVQPETLF